MNLNEIEIQAKEDGVLTAADLEQKLLRLKSAGRSLIECIMYVRINQGCSLMDAKDTVINSQAWLEQKESFLNFQEVMHQGLIRAAMENADEIKMTITPEHVTFDMKS